MPAPIVPPPTTTVRSRLLGVTAFRLSGRRAARSAKNTWRNALHSVVDRSARNAARSTAKPVSKSVVAVISTRVMAFSGAAWPRIFLAARLRAALAASGAGAGAGMADTGGRANAASRSAIQPASTGSSASASTSPASCAAAARRLRPSGIIARAAPMPTRRGRRCVPPDPGTTPRITSGSPSCADLSAMRQRQASASSSPPPRQAPRMAASTGNRDDSMAATTCGRVGSVGAALNSPASAPAAKMRPAPARMIRSSDPSADNSASAARSPARIS